jgi:hypothetical protein
MRPGVCVAFTSGLLAVWAMVSGQPQPGQSASHEAPPVPYVDAGACPFEGCAYREWTANDTVIVRTARHTTASVAYVIRKGERITALTGIVTTVKAGRVRFRNTVNLQTASGTLHVERGQTLYLLTYRGEGFTKAWFLGRIYDDVDGAMAFFNDLCGRNPRVPCDGEILERPQSIWWVEVRNARGQTGWTDQPARFDGKDSLGK